MFQLRRSGFLFWRKVRLIAPEGIGPEDFNELANRLATKPRRARKQGLVFARQAAAPERVETRWNGHETQNTAQPGDWIVTLSTPAGEQLRDRDGHANVSVIRAARFPDLYSPARDPNGAITEDGLLFAPKGVVDALLLSGGFEIKAPWGEMQTAPAGYILRNGMDVYGNNFETFEATYVFID